MTHDIYTFLLLGELFCSCLCLIFADALLVLFEVGMVGFVSAVSNSITQTQERLTEGC